MTTIALALTIVCFSTQLIAAQIDTNETNRIPRFMRKSVFGFCQTLFFGDMKTQLLKSYGGAFEPGIGNNLMMGFYVAPENWNGLGVGSRIKGTFGTSVKGDNGDNYIFNYYNVAITAKYYPLSNRFNQGLYARGSVGFGQLTTKRVNESINLYKHQYAIGNSFMGAIGYTITLGKTALNIDVEYDYSNRNGTIDNLGTAIYKSGQIGCNIGSLFLKLPPPRIRELHYVP